LQKLPEPAAMAAIDSLEAPARRVARRAARDDVRHDWDDEFFDGGPNPRSTIVRYLRLRSLLQRSLRQQLAHARSRDRCRADARYVASEGVRFPDAVNLSYQLIRMACASCSRCGTSPALKVLSSMVRAGWPAVAAIGLRSSTGRVDKLDSDELRRFARRRSAC